MARKSTAKAKATPKAKSSPKSAKKPVAMANQPSTRRIVETTTFRDGKTGKVIHMDVKTKARGKIITASVGGKVKSIAISR